MTPRAARAAAFLSGACVLVLELVGSRLLSPVFGSSLYVWSSVITVTLAALAAGAWAGGLLADGRDSQRWPARLFAAAGLWLAAAPFARKAVLGAAAGLGLKAGSLLAALVLLGLPLGALGAVAPLCVRLCAASLAGVGRAAGSVSALGTFGSVLGALAAGFWLLPALSAALLLEAVAGVLFAAAALLSWGARGAAGAAGAAALCALLSYAVPPNGSRRAKVLAAEDSLYGAVRVVDRLDWGRRVLYIDGVANTVASLPGLHNTSEYMLAFEAAAASAAGRGARRALLVGLGGGALVKRLATYNIATDVAELDPAILRLARDWFDFKPTGEVWLEDGRRVLERPGADYDLVYLDAFAGDQTPEQVFSLEAFQAARRRLKPGGMLVFNLIGRASGPEAGFARAALRTLREVFPEVRMLVPNLGLPPDAEVVNLVFYASDAPFAPDPAGFSQRPELVAWWKTASSQWVDPGGGGALVTDDFNPVAMLSAPGMAEMRAMMLSHGEGVDL
ncbi:MAG: fused MFS/spermidine synthase [Elusimicrobia bacterium]|nr:fused MFS/spermidine synthase [Elusimicrobiota bacterium]